MSSSPTESKAPKLPDDALPPVEAPGAGFILQLFFIPMLIVAIIVSVWLAFSWLAQMGTNPQELATKLQKGDDAAWQRAVTLADMLRTKEHLKHDTELANELVSALQQQLDAGSTNPNQINMRIYLCRALGEFLIPDVLPVLMQAALTERDAESIEPPPQGKTRTLTELDVRRAALEAIAVHLQNMGVEDRDHREKLIEVLTQATSERGVSGRDEELRGELRSTAAYVLGVLGGEDALARLDRVLGDPYANARYNAAAGLARYGDVRAIPELIDMLDPDNEESVENERHQSGKSFKRWLVVTTAIQATATLAENNQSDDLSELAAALEDLADSDVPTKVQVKAREAIIRLKERNP